MQESKRHIISDDKLIDKNNISLWDNLQARLDHTLGKHSDQNNNDEDNSSIKAYKMSLFT